MTYRVRAYHPLPADHPAVSDGDQCRACGSPFTEGDVTTLVPLGPGDDDEARRKAAEGRPYNAVAALCHFACVFGREAREEDF